MTDKKIPTEPTVVGSTAFHIHNGGVKISVLDTDNGPQVQMSAEHFGNPTADSRVYVDRAGLRKLAAMFANASEHMFREEPYCFHGKA
jgi:hypothetical protein